jgi:hypothetical protein
MAGILFRGPEDWRRDGLGRPAEFFTRRDGLHPVDGVAHELDRRRNSRSESAARMAGPPRSVEADAAAAGRQHIGYGNASGEMIG